MAHRWPHPRLGVAAGGKWNRLRHTNNSEIRIKSAERKTPTEWIAVRKEHCCEALIDDYSSWRYELVLLLNGTAAQYPQAERLEISAIYRYNGNRCALFHHF